MKEEKEPTKRQIAEAAKAAAEEPAGMVTSNTLPDTNALYPLGVQPAEEPTNVCPGCNGRKFIEFESGTVCIPCSTCNGTGEFVNEEPTDDNTSEDGDSAS